MLSPRTNPGQGSGPVRYPGTFLQALREAVGALNWQLGRSLGTAIECVDAEGHRQLVGLENLFRRARRAPRADWPNLLKEHLLQALASDQAGAAPTELSAVADQLLIRLGQPFSPGAGGEPLWSQPLAGTDLVINLVVDFPNRMIYVTEKDVGAAGQPGHHWLEKALANLRGRTPAGALQPIHEESGLLACMVGDAYDSSRALLLDVLVAGARERGCFVGLPARDQLLVLPVTADSLGFVHLLKIIVDKHYKSLPYPISDQVYWVQKGVWRRCPVRMEGSKVTIESPPEFGGILDQLTPEAGTAEEDGGSAEEEPPAPHA